MSRFFVSIYRFFKHNTVLFWVVFVGIIGLSGVGISQLDFVEDIGSFLPQNANNKRINYAYQHIGASNKIIINIKETGTFDSTHQVDCDLLIEAANRLSERLHEYDTMHAIKELLFEVDQQQVSEVTDFVIQNMPYFLTEEDYERIDTLLMPQHIEQQLNSDKQILAAPVSMLQSVILSDPLFFSSAVLQQLSHFQLNDQYHIEDDHIFNKEGTEAVVVVTSNYPVSETAENGKLAATIEKAIHSVENDLDHRVEAGSFGASLISITNAQQIKKDSLLAILLSFTLIMLLLIYFYRNGRSILLIALAVLFGGIVALGTIVLFKNPVSIIAVGVSSIIIGIAVNYPIHFLAHYNRTGHIEQIIKDIVNPLLIGNITTVGAFLSLLFISSDAMKDLGLFSALLLIGTILFVLVFLPHFLRNKPAGEIENNRLAFKKIADYKPEKNPWIVSIVLVLTVLFFIFSFRTSFETNMQEINYMTDEQRTTFHRLIAESDTSLQTVYCIIEASEVEEALQQYEKATPFLQQLTEEHVAKKVSSIDCFLPSKQLQQEKIKRWNDFWQTRKEPFTKTFYRKAAQAGYNTAAFDGFMQTLSKDFQPQSIDYFEPILKNLASNYLVINNDKTLIYNILKVDKRQTDYSEQLLNKVSGNIFAFSDKDIATRMVTALSDDFNYVLYICGCIVLLFLFLSFGRVEITLMAFIPLTVAWAWIMGIMGIAGLKFNIVNIILATFIFGQGDDYSIFVTEGLLYENRFGKKMLSQFKNSIVLSSCIMFVGIGMLIFAKHPAMRSLAEVTVIGMFSVVVMAYVFPPLIFNLLTRKKGKPRLFPVTLWNFSKSIITFLIFLFGSILLTITGFFMFTLCRKSEKKRYFFHQILCNTFRFLSKIMIQVKCNVENSHGEDFQKPAVIISNHQSHFDLLYTLMLSPKIVVLTNQRVWNSPFYKWIIRYAEFMPISDGVDANIPKLQELVRKGYSILFFPEGTRSVTCDILRFHQGAFHVADQLNLDILPIVLHGIGHVLPKKENILRSGSVTVNILSRIKPNDPTFRNGRSAIQTAQLVRRLYKNEYADMIHRLEDSAYYRDLVVHNYIYKGKDIERKCRHILKEYDNFAKLICSMPEQGTVLIKNCGQGEISLMMALVKRRLQITATEADEDDISIARNCVAVPSNLKYQTAVDDESIYNYIIDNNNIVKQEDE